MSLGTGMDTNIYNCWVPCLGPCSWFLVLGSWSCTASSPSTIESPGPANPHVIQPLWASEKQQWGTGKGSVLFRSFQLWAAFYCIARNWPSAFSVLWPFAKVLELEFRIRLRIKGPYSIFFSFFFSFGRQRERESSHGVRGVSFFSVFHAHQ